MVNKRVRNAVLGCYLKNDRRISVCFQGKPFSITVIQAYAPTSNAEEAEVERFCEDLQDLLEITPQKDVLLIIGDWNAKVGSQKIPGVTGKFGLGVRNEAGQRLMELCQENTLVIANTLFQQHKRRLYTWTSPDGQYQNQIDYILCSQKWRSSIQSAKTRWEADYGSDHELLIAKFRLKLKKVGQITRPFWYGLNRISYDYTVEVTNRFMGLDLIKQSIWRARDGGLWHCRGGSDQDHPQEKKMQIGKMVVWGGLTNSWEKKKSERQRRKGNINPFEIRVLKNSQERFKKPSSVINANK